MTTPRVMVRKERKGERSRSAIPLPASAWFILGGLGLVFLLVAGADILLGWYPPNFGSAEWRFGTVTSSLNSYPLLVLGLALMMGSGVARGSRNWTRGVAVALLLVTGLTLVEAVLYFPTIGQALSAAANVTLKAGLKTAITKTVIQLIAYPIALVWLAVMSWKASSQ